MIRKIKRNSLRNKVGNKGLQIEWRNSQIAKYETLVKFFKEQGLNKALISGKELYNKIRRNNLSNKQKYAQRKYLGTMEF